MLLHGLMHIQDSSLSSTPWSVVRFMVWSTLMISACHLYPNMCVCHFMVWSTLFISSCHLHPNMCVCHFMVWSTLMISACHITQICESVTSWSGAHSEYQLVIYTIIVSLLLHGLMHIDDISLLVIYTLNMCLSLHGLVHIHDNILSSTP